MSGGEFEIRDNEGSSEVESGTATTTPTAYPTTPGNIISGVSLQVGLTDIQISFDGGTTYFNVERRGFFSHNVKGNITQVTLKTLSGTSDFELLLNLEDY
jgi:hypothetical protein